MRCLDKSRQSGRHRRGVCPGSPVVRPAVAEPGCDMLTGRQQRVVCPGSPVVRPAVAEPGCGMLTDRQMTWLEEFPYQSTTENPVLYKLVCDTMCIII